MRCADTLCMHSVCTQTQCVYACVHAYTVCVYSWCVVSCGLVCVQVLGVQQALGDKGEWGYMGHAPAGMPAPHAHVLKRLLLLSLC